jgi:hypothetical protein
MGLQLKSVNTYGVCPERFATLSILESKSTGNVCNFLCGYFWMFHLLLHNCGTIHFLTQSQGIIKMVWNGDGHFKQQAVTEFLVAE